MQAPNTEDTPPASATWALAAVLAPTDEKLAPSLFGPGGFFDELRHFCLSHSAQRPGASGPWHAVVAVSPAQHRALLAGWPHPGSPPAHWPLELPDGFHRLFAGEGVVTLCVGDVPTSVAQWQLKATHLWASTDGLPPSVWPALWRALARRCAAHTRLHWHSQGAETTHPQNDTPAPAGFVPDGRPQRWLYRPRWPVPAWPTSPQRRALVIGAGLAGAAVCDSLTQRGWHVTLLDAADGPAQGASGLPVGLMSEHHTAQPTVLSRLSRCGVVAHRRVLEQHVGVGQGWMPTQVTQWGPGADDDVNSAPSSTPLTLDAATVRPQVLVQAWLDRAHATGRLACVWQSPVAQLRRDPHTGAWQAVSQHGQVWAQATHAVVAAAHGSAALLGMERELRPVKGQLSYGPLEGPPLAAHPLRNQGVYVPCHDDATHPHGPHLWAMGSTYERGHSNTTVTTAGHDRNAASLAQTLPAAHAVFESQRERGLLRGWAQVRCASLDRLPLVGAVPAPPPWPAHTPLDKVPRQPGLWALCALGSRGLTLTGLAAELLAAQMNHEPWPVEAELGRALDPARFALKWARKKA